MISLHADPTSPAGIAEGGGTHSYIRELLTYFSTQKDINILLITRKSDPNLPEIENVSSICRIQRIIIKNELPINKKELFALHDISLSKIEAAIKKNTFVPDLIHSIYWNSGQIAQYLSNTWNIPFVHTVISNGLRRQHSGMVEEIKQRFKIEREIFQAATCIFCITPSEREDLKELYHISEEKIMVVGRPVSQDFLYPAHDDFGIPYRFKVNSNNISTKSLLKLEHFKLTNSSDNMWWRKDAFIYCGRLASNKGVDIILKSWYQLKQLFKNDCPSLWIVGGSLDEIALLKNGLKKEYNFEKYEARGELIWWGYLDQRGISTLLLKSQALLMHSLYEPGGRIIIEAMASGIPVIATSCGFGADYIVNWYNGFQVSYGDIKQLVHIMALFIKQPYLSNSLGINAKEYMKKLFKNWDFFGSHQLVYETVSIGSSRDFSHSGIVAYNEGIPNYINVYPFFNDIISNDELKKQLGLIVNSNLFQIVSVSERGSAIWVLKTDSTEYEVWQPYTRLLDSMYLYSFIENNVDKRKNQYERELYAPVSYINPIIYSFDNYYLYIKRKYTQLSKKHFSDTNVLLAIKRLFIQFYAQEKNSIENSMQIFEQNWEHCNITSIKEVYHAFYEDVPDFLYRNYCINYTLALRQLYFVFDDSANNISIESFKLYQKCEPFLWKMAKNYTPRYGICLTDCSIENMIFNEKTSTCIFRSASTLYWGDITRMSADFLHELLLFKTNNGVFDCITKHIEDWEYIDSKNSCIGWLFIITFERLLLYEITMKTSKYVSEINLLKALIKLYILS